MVHEFIRAWARRYPADAVFLAIPGTAPPSPAPPPGATILRARLAPHGISAMAWLPRLARQARADLVLSQNFTPLTGRAAVFIHDVLFQTNPEWFSRRERAYLAPIPVLARRAEVVLTSSASEAERIRSRNPGLPRVVPVGLAVKTSLLTATPQRPDLAFDVDSFLLSVGRLNVRKNLRTGLAAAIASGTLSPQRPLLVVGAPDGPGEQFDAQISEAIADGRIVFLGALSDAEVVWLYRHARCLIFLSRDEGFGLPPVEAQTFGCPVVVSDIPVMREVCGAGALFVDPDDVLAAASAIRGAVAGGRLPVRMPEGDPWIDIVERISAAVER